MPKKPWAILYRTPSDRYVYIVHHNANGSYAPINGPDGTVRVEYVDAAGNGNDDYGYERPADLTPVDN